MINIKPNKVIFTIKNDTNLINNIYQSKDYCMSNIIELGENTFYDKTRKKFFFIINLLYTLPTELFFMCKDEDGYYTKKGKIWEYYYKNPLCWRTRTQNSYIKEMNILYHGDNEIYLSKLNGDLWSEFKYRTYRKYKIKLYMQDDIRNRYLHNKLGNLDNEIDIKNSVSFEDVVFQSEHKNYIDTLIMFQYYIEYCIGTCCLFPLTFECIEMVKAMCRANGVEGYDNLNLDQLSRVYMLADEPLRVRKDENRIYFEDGRSIPLDD